MSTEVGQTSAPTVLLGFPRSGTNYLSFRVSQHPNVTVLIEPFSMHCPAIFGRRGEYWPGAGLDRTRYHRSVPLPSGIRTFLGEFRDQGLQPTGPADRRVFKETFLFLQLGWLQQYLPDLRIVYLYRDPAEVAASFVKHGLYQKWHYRKYFETVRRSVKREPDLARYRPLVAAVDPASAVDVVTALRVMLDAEWHRHRDSFDHISIRFNDLRDDPNATLEQIWKFLDVPCLPPVLPATQSTPRGDMYSRYPQQTANRSLSTAQQKRIDELGGLL